MKAGSRPNLAILRETPSRAGWSELDEADLETWVQRRCLDRARRYFEEGRVESLTMTAEGELLAWVRGSEWYAVRIVLTADNKARRLVSVCTCPVAYSCKHAVAVLLAYLQSRGPHGRRYAHRRKSLHRAGPKRAC